MEMPRRTAPPNDATRVAHVEIVRVSFCASRPVSLQRDETIREHSWIVRQRQLAL
jgi:hypothetical protein